MVEHLVNASTAEASVTFLGSWLKVIGVSLGGVIGLYVISLVLRAAQFARLDRHIKQTRKDIGDVKKRIQNIEKALDIGEKK